MFGQPTPTARRLMQERNTRFCEIEGCHNLATEAHHCLHGAKRGKRPVKELDMDENLQLVCEPCHAVEAKSYENKVYFWHKQCERLGHKHMVDWYASVPLKIKEHAYK